MTPRHLYRVTARVPWGMETYQVAAPDHLAAVEYVRHYAQPKGAVPAEPMTWEKVSN